MISSAAGLGWEANLELVSEYLDTPDFDSAAAWIEANGHADYMFSKQTSAPTSPARRCRCSNGASGINAILPGPPTRRSHRPTQTCGSGSARTTARRRASKASTPDEQAGPLAFLCSDAARYVNGITMITDAGYVSSGLTESFPAQAGGRLPLRPLLDPSPLARQRFSNVMPDVSASHVPQRPLRPGAHASARGRRGCAATRRGTRCSGAGRSRGARRCTTGTAPPRSAMRHPSTIAVILRSSSVISLGTACTATSASAPWPIRTRSTSKLEMFSPRRRR